MSDNIRAALVLFGGTAAIFAVVYAAGSGSRPAAQARRPAHHYEIVLAVGDGHVTRHVWGDALFSTDGGCAKVWADNSMVAAACGNAIVTELAE